MSDHETFRDLVPAVALGAATESETAALERHAATCHDCRTELDLLRGAAAGLALEVPQLDPPAELKRQVMDAVRAEGRTHTPPEPVGRRRTSRWSVVAGVLAALAAGLVAWNVTLQQRDGGGGREISVTAAAASGRVVIGDDGTAVMRLTGLPELPADQGYELWSIRDGTPRSEGFAARTAQGELVVATADLAGVSALAITPEKRSNTAAPSVTPLVVVSLA